jgi:hypothetical protein
MCLGSSEPRPGVRSLSPIKFLLRRTSRANTAGTAGSAGSAGSPHNNHITPRTPAPDANSDRIPKSGNPEFEPEGSSATLVAGGVWLGSRAMRPNDRSKRLSPFV